MTLVTDMLVRCAMHDCCSQRWRHLANVNKLPVHCTRSAVQRWFAF